MTDPKQQEKDEQTRATHGIPEGSQEGEAKGVPPSDREQTEKAANGDA